MPEKQRLDIALVQANIASSRSAAQAMIMAGEITVNNTKQTKASYMVSQQDILQAKQKLRYVSRGGLKLEKALKVFGINLCGKTCMDIGASTGGFTDCMLQNGASKVYAIDVGYGQLDYSLRQDSRVVCLERMNARMLDSSLFESVSFASIDVSFISLKLILPSVFACIDDQSQLAVLIKPQFEAGREHIGKNGVVRDKSVHMDVCQDIIRFAYEQGFSALTLDYSPVKGPKGNIEYLLHLKKQPDNKNCISKEKIKTCVEESHNTMYNVSGGYSV